MTVTACSSSLLAAARICTKNLSASVKDDPAIAMFYGGVVPVAGAFPTDPTQPGIIRRKLKERLMAVVVNGVLNQPGRRSKYKNANEFLIDLLLEK